MAPPDGIAGAGKARLYLSTSENAQHASENRTEVLARRLDQQLNDRLEQIRDQMRRPEPSPNGESTGNRLDIFA
jgi:hypothetical protein